jgi:hypothetical protein
MAGGEDVASRSTSEVRKAVLPWRLSRAALPTTDFGTSVIDHPLPIEVFVGAL